VDPGESSIDSLVAEAEMLATQGVKELNLIAQDLTAYGRERRMAQRFLPYCVP